MHEHFALNITMLAVKTNIGIEKFTIWGINRDRQRDRLSVSKSYQITILGLKRQFSNSTVTTSN